MGFVWNENVSQDELITKAAMEEMRDNIDLVVDNLIECFEHNATYNSDQDTAWDLQDYSTWYYMHDSGYDAGLKVTYKFMHYDQYLGGNLWAYRSTHYGIYRANDKANYK